MSTTYEKAESKKKMGLLRKEQNSFRLIKHYLNSYLFISTNQLSH